MGMLVLVLRVRQGHARCARTAPRAENWCRFSVHDCQPHAESSPGPSPGTPPGPSVSAGEQPPGGGLPLAICVTLAAAAMSRRGEEPCARTRNTGKRARRENGCAVLPALC